LQGEDRLTAWLRRRLGPGSLIGDDAAALPAAIERAIASGKPACVNVMIESIPSPIIR
jgi:acetolactate synthase-1/2/3 large subunit